MMWEKVAIKDICTGIYDGPHATPPLSDTGAIFLGISNFNNGRLDFSDIRYISEDDLPKWTKRVIPQKNDIVFSYEATLNLYAIIPEGFRGCLGRRMALLRVDETKADYKFLYYYFYSDAWRATVNENIVLGATVDRIPLIKFPDFPVELPPLETQHRIADILFAYDDLIENNQKQIKLLEEAAQRLYKEWFVDLNFPGHENTKIVDGVPEGWQYEKLGDLVKTTSGGTPSRRKSEYYVNGNIRWIKTKELNDRFIFETEEHITEDAVKNSSAKVLPEGALIVAMYGATIGKIGITAAEMACNQACCAFISFDDMISKEYLYCWLMDNREYLVSQGKGAAQSNLSQEMIRNFSLLCPDKKVIKYFTEIVTTMLENKRVLENKILMLSKARDDLLPKLMSGEVEV